MKVLVVCPTYGRLPYLGRMVASFLSQTYTNSDLVIINDDPNIKLKISHERILVVNIDTKLMLDVKKNIGSVMGRDYDLIMPLDDDDIFLSKQIEYHVNHFLSNPNLNLFRNTTAYVVYGDEFKISGNTPNNIAFTPDIYFKVGGYSKFDTNSGGDTVFYDKIGDKLVISDLENLFFVYNFGGVNYHVSCMNENNLEQIAYTQRMSLKCGPEFEIVPDFIKYNEFETLATKIKLNNNKPFLIKHISDATIKFD